MHRLPPHFSFLISQCLRMRVGITSGSPEAHHMTSTKNSLGFPMAMRKDWREAVSSGGTEDRSRSGGEPGAAVTGVCGCGGRPGAPHTRLWAWEWVLRIVCELRTLCSLGGAAERSLGAFSLFSDSLPLPDRPPDSCVPATAFASFLLPLRFEPLLRLPASEIKERKSETFYFNIWFYHHCIHLMIGWEDSNRMQGQDKEYLHPGSGFLGHFLNNYL